jgi:HAMP domain-containing protein
MASNLTAQVRNISEVTIAVANGDLSRKITVDVRGEILQLKEAINTMVDQLRSFASEVTRVAREVGTEGRLGGQAVVPGVAGTWKDLTDNVNLLAANLTTQVRNIAKSRPPSRAATSRARSRWTCRAKVLELKNTINTMVDQLNAFASEVTRVAREVGTEGKLGGQAQVPGVGRHMEGPDRQRQLHGEQPDRPGAQHRRSRHRHRQRRPVEEDHGERVGRDPAAQGNAQHDGGPAERVRRRSDARGARGRHGRDAWAARPWCRACGHVEGP